MATKFSIRQEPGFYLDRDKATMPQVPGIYVVYKCNYDPYTDRVEVIEPLYIGETQNIHELHNGTPDNLRIHEHYDDFVREAGGAEHICYGVVQMEGYSDEERKWIQDAMIFRQKPPVNVSPEKEHYSHPAIDLTLQGFPNCWKSFHIFMPYNNSDEVGL